MAKYRTVWGVIFCSVCAIAAAQTPGIGDTRPMPTEKKAPPAGAEAHKPPSEPDRELKRCDDFSGTRREDCLRELRAAEGRAAAGSTRRPEPPTAPPPNNPGR